VVAFLGVGVQAIFRSDHDRLINLADGLIAEAQKGTGADPVRLNQLRLGLSRTVADHCSAEDGLIQSCGRPADGDAYLVALNQRYHDELMHWRVDLVRCHGEWPPARIRVNSQEFLEEFMPIAAALAERLRWEEEEFFPAVLADCVRIA
jgi:hypothetical protein